MLQTHDDVLALPDDHKEHCYGAKSNRNPVKFPGFTWLNFYYERRVPGKQLVNGCMSTTDLEYRLQFNPPSPADPYNHPKWFLIFRDPADWMWSIFNFFYDDHLEDRPKANGWTDETMHYRSPELFHEFILSGGLMKEGGLLKPSHYMFGWREDSVEGARRLKAAVGDENVLFLKNEDMLPDKVESSGLLEKVSKATGLSISGFDPKYVHSKTNCGDQKGLKGELCDDRKEAPKGGYTVSGNRPMLQATRRLIYMLWHEECQIWAEEFNIVYPDCLNVMNH